MTAELGGGHEANQAPVAPFLALGIEKEDGRGPGMPKRPCIKAWSSSSLAVTSAWSRTKRAISAATAGSEKV